MNYTKGEWILHPNVRNWIVLDDDNTKSIGQVFNINDAQLMSSAPNMYEVLKKITENEQVAGRPCPYCNKHLDHTRNCIYLLAEKAIAKAEGR